MRRFLEALARQSAEMEPPPTVPGPPVEPDYGWDLPPYRPFRWMDDGCWPASYKIRRRIAEQEAKSYPRN